MKGISRCVIMVLVLSVFQAFAAVPAQINYQGYLTAPDGTALDTAVAVTFSLYADPAGGSAIWTETQSACSVRVGLFSALLTIPAAHFADSNRWLGVAIGDNDEMTPRRKVTTSAYAFHAGFADTAGYASQAAIAPGSIVNAQISPVAAIAQSKIDNTTRAIDADRLDGLHANSFGQLDASQTWPGAQTFSNGSNQFSGTGTGLTNLNAGNLTTGTLSDSRLSGNVTLQGNSVNGANNLVKLDGSTRLPAVNGSLLTNVVPGSGTVSDVQVASGANIAPSKISGTAWTSTNDGSGSGLDADLLDGQHASSFLYTAQAAGGDLTGTYPNPTIGANRVTTSKMADGAVTSAKISAPVSLSGSTSGSILSGTNSGTGNGVYGLSSSGYYGYLGAGSNCGAYGQSSSGNYGHLGNSYQGAFGRNTNGNWGALGNVNGGAYGESSSGNYGHLGNSTGGAYGQNSGASNYGYLGTSSYGVYARSTSGTAAYCYGGFYQGGGVFEAHPTSTTWSTSKPATVKLNDGSKVKLFAEEAAEVYFNDYGEGDLDRGKAHIELDPIYLQTVTIDTHHPIRAFVELEGDCNGVFVANKTASGFDVIEFRSGTSNAHFTYRVVCKRKYYEDERLATDEQDVQYNTRMLRTAWPEVIAAQQAEQAKMRPPEQSQESDREKMQLMPGVK